MWLEVHQDTFHDWAIPFNMSFALLRDSGRPPIVLVSGELSEQSGKLLLECIVFSLSLNPKVVQCPIPSPASYSLVGWWLQFKCSL